MAFTPKNNPVVAMYVRTIQFMIAASVFFAMVMLCFAVWRWQQTQSQQLNSNAQLDLQNALASTNCPYNDKELCMFLLAWQRVPGYTTETTFADDDYKVKTIFKAIGSNRFQLRVSGSESYEAIGLGTTVYIYDSSTSRWWQQTVPQELVGRYKGEYEYGFDLPPPSMPAEERTSYVAFGRETCGEETCQKYQVINPHNDPAVKQFIWFDAAEYELRRVQLEHGDGSISEHEVVYGPVTITPPADADKVSAYDIFPPGSSQKVRIPNGLQPQEYLEQLFSVPAT